MSLPEEAEKAAKGVVDALKEQPVGLALLIINVALVCLFAYAHGARQDQWTEQLRLILTVCNLHPDD